MTNPKPEQPMVLMPCPFCGSHADIVRGDDLNGNAKWHKVYCKKCQNRTWEHPKKRNAIDAWNCRPAPQQGWNDATREKLQDALDLIDCSKNEHENTSHSNGLYDLVRSLLDQQLTEPAWRDMESAPKEMTVAEFEAMVLATHKDSIHICFVQLGSEWLPAAVTRMAELVNYTTEAKQFLFRDSITSIIVPPLPGAPE